jgi:hypothetical protein
MQLKNSFRKTKNTITDHFQSGINIFCVLSQNRLDKKKTKFQIKITMLYTGQLNEFIRLAEIDATNCDLLKEKSLT